jgi:Zn-dependent peptidase ImmA (M78 family)
MPTLERGFKSWCERSALATRTELSIDAHAPLAARRLAGHLGVTLLTPSDLPGLPTEILHQLTHKDPHGWSAVSFAVEGQVTIIYNDRNSSGRQSSDIMHELSHIVLDHDPSQVILSVDGSIGMRSFDAKQEDEANWLGWTLLLPRPALMQCTHLGLSTAQIAVDYDVSEQLVKYRVGITGIHRQSRARGSARSR